MTSPYTGFAGQRLTALLTHFTNMCLAGRIPLDVGPVFYGAVVSALAKKGGGIRPVAIGSTVRRGRYFNVTVVELTAYSAIVSAVLQHVDRRVGRYAVDTSTEQLAG
jgi:hypothetical protein